MLLFLADCNICATLHRRGKLLNTIFYLPSWMNFGFSKVPSVSNQESVENAIVTIMIVNKKLKSAPLTTLVGPSDAMLAVASKQLLW